MGWKQTMQAVLSVLFVFILGQVVPMASAAFVAGLGLGATIRTLKRDDPQRSVPTVLSSRGKWYAGVFYLLGWLCVWGLLYWLATEITSHNREGTTRTILALAGYTLGSFAVYFARWVAQETAPKDVT